MQNNLPDNKDFIHKLHFTIFISSKKKKDRKVSVISCSHNVNSNMYAVFFFC